MGYAKRDLVVPGAVRRSRGGERCGAAWCAEVNGAVHYEICAVPAERLVAERDLRAPLPSLRAGHRQGWSPARSDRLSCIRFASARYSFPVG